MPFSVMLFYVNISIIPQWICNYSISFIQGLTGNGLGFRFLCNELNREIDLDVIIWSLLYKKLTLLSH